MEAAETLGRLAVTPVGNWFGVDVSGKKKLGAAMVRWLRKQKVTEREPLLRTKKGRVTHGKFGRPSVPEPRLAHASYSAYTG